MGNRSGLLALFIGCLVLTVFIAGCSDESPSGGTPATTPTAASSEKYTTGDIIAKTATASSSDTFMLIVRYDTTVDKYERALVYKKSDGSFYRRDEKTDLLSRSTTEKLYPAKITHVSSLSQVPVVTPTTATTAPTEAVTATPTTSYPAPSVYSITPSSGTAGTTVTITSIMGSSFRPGATVRLTNATTSATISGKSVNVESASNISCIVTIPSTAIAGLWNVTVTNLDGKYGTLARAFTITNASSVTSPVVTSILPSSGVTGTSVDITSLAGTNLLGVTSVKLQKTGESDISATSVTAVSSSQVTCSFSLAGKTAGLWDVKVINSAGKSDTASDLFTIYPVASFSGTNLIDSPSHRVQFTDLSEGSPTIWHWDFGDGTTSTVQNPVHTYPEADTYSVTLTVSNDGISDTTSIDITAG